MEKNNPVSKSIEKIKQQDAKKKDFKVREGQADSSVLHDKEPSDANTYPKKNMEDRQYNNQPEYTERDNNQSKDANSK